MKGSNVLEPVSEVDVLIGANATKTKLLPGTVVAKFRYIIGEIPEGAQALLDGTPVGDSQVISMGTRTVEFVKPAGSKG